MIFPAINFHNPMTIFFMGFYGVMILILLRLALTLWRARHNRRATVDDLASEAKLPPIKISSHDISAIAGDDKLATQLDLARAYIESGRKQLAKKILTDVLDRGDIALQHEAHRLMQLL